MKTFRPDQDQLSMYKLRKIKCNVCFDQFDRSLLVAHLDCCNCYVHMHCLHEMAASLDSATIFRCPECHKELSGESVRAAGRRTSPTGKGKCKDNEMLLGSVATQDVTARKRSFGSGFGSGSEGKTQDPRYSSQSLSRSLESAGPSKGNITTTKASAEEGSGPSQEQSSERPMLTLFPPYEEMEIIVGAEQNKNSRSENSLDRLLGFIFSRRKREVGPAMEDTGPWTPTFYSENLSMMHGQPFKQLVPL